jgi:transcriptional regulator with XRE-family HTH domain
LTFQDAQLKLLAQVRDRIRNGELTERGFARLIGVSQPHIHNVLKGVRKLSPKIFDSILKYFHMSLLDLVPLDELNAYLQRQLQARLAEAPFLNSPLGPGIPWPSGLNRRKRFPLPFPSTAVPSNLVMANLASDPQMHPSLTGYDVALLDTSEPIRSKIAPEGLYAVQRHDEALLRYIRPGARVYYLVSDATMNTPTQWERLYIPPRDLTAMVKARVRWLGRERDRDLPAHQRGRFLYDAISS